MIRDRADRDEKIAALTERYRAGELTETVFLVSLRIENVTIDEMRYLIDLYQPAHRNSVPYRKGLVS